MQSGSSKGSRGVKGTFIFKIKAPRKTEKPGELTGGEDFSAEGPKRNGSEYVKTHIESLFLLARTCTLGERAGGRKKTP